MLILGIIQRKSYLLILIGCDGYKLRFFEGKCAEFLERQLGNIVSTYHMKSWLILVHWIQNSLQKRMFFEKQKTIKKKYVYCLETLAVGFCFHKLSFTRGAQSFGEIKSTSIKPPGESIDSYELNNSRQSFSNGAWGTFWNWRV